MEDNATQCKPFIPPLSTPHLSCAFFNKPAHRALLLNTFPSSYRIPFSGLAVYLPFIELFGCFLSSGAVFKLLPSSIFENVSLHRRFCLGKCSVAAR